MKIFLFILTFFVFSAATQAKTLATYTYLKARKKVEKKISLNEFKKSYTIIKLNSFNAPNAKIFFNDYLRFKLGVEIALHEKKLVKSPSLIDQITNPLLKGSFEQELYKSFAELKLQKQMRTLDKKASNLKASTLRALYGKSPEYNFQFISVKHPVGPNKAQIKEALARAKKIYSQVAKSKKPFAELVRLYSDEKALGALLVNRSRNDILPAVYRNLRKMNSNTISKPLRVATGYYIVRLNRKIPFKEARQSLIKATYFNQERTKIFNNYFNLKKLKAQFKIKLLNQNLLRTLK